jgi:hypothetical protein
MKTMFLVLAAALALFAIVWVLGRLVAVLCTVLQDFLAVVSRLVVACLVASGLALAAGLIAGALASESDAIDPIPSGLIAAAATWMLTFGLLIWRQMSTLGRARSENEFPNASVQAGPEQSLVEPERPYLNDPELTRLRDELNLLIPWQSRRLDAALARCDGVLRLAAGNNVNFSLLEWAQFIQRRIPELVSATVALLDGANSTERRRLLNNLSDDLDRIGAEAEQRVTDARADERHRLEILRLHVSNRTSGTARISI